MLIAYEGPGRYSRLHRDGYGHAQSREALTIADIESEAAGGREVNVQLQKDGGHIEIISWQQHQQRLAAQKVPTATAQAEAAREAPLIPDWAYQDVPDALGVSSTWPPDEAFQA